MAKSIHRNLERAVLSEITPLILTFNEAPNLARALGRVEWANCVVVLDSFSTDETEQIARSFENVVFIQRRFDRHAAQWNFGLDQVETPWVLSLDADYFVTEELRDEMARLPLDAAISAYSARFRYCLGGRVLRGSLYPPRPVLFQKTRCRYVQDGHTQVLAIEGPTKFLNGYILHDDRKPLSRWLDSQRSYARLEAQKLIEAPGGPRSLADRLRRWIWPAAPAAFLYSLMFKGCLFDGWPGWFYALQRTYAELLLSLELLDRRLCATGRLEQADSRRVEGGDDSVSRAKPVSSLSATVDVDSR
jgi:glycosyltransferase involved in cell wall biosynthesis